MSIKISIINFKGGVGKTTLSFHFAAFLAKFGPTLLVDVDHQSSLSIATMGSEQWEARVPRGLTVNRVFESFCNRKIAMPGTEIISFKPLMYYATDANGYNKLDIVPSQFELDDTEIDLASTFYGNAFLSDWEKRTLLATWLDNIKAESLYKYIIFDCPPATKIVSQNALAASDFYIIPVIPDNMSSRGVTHFKALVETKIDEKLAFLRKSARIHDDAVPRSFSPETRLAAIVPSLAKAAGNAASGLINAHAEQLAELRKKWGTAVTATVIKNFAGITEAMDSGWPAWDWTSRNITPSVLNMMNAVCQELKDRVDP